MINLALIGLNNVKLSIEKDDNMVTIDFFSDYFSKYEITPEDIEKIKFISAGKRILKEPIDTDDKDIFCFTQNIELREKLKNIFITNGKDTRIKIIDDSEEPPEYNESEKEAVNSEENLKEVITLFNDKDFKFLLNIYKTRPELFEELFKFIHCGDIISELPDDVQDDGGDSANTFDKEIELLKTQIEDLDEAKIRDILRKYNGNINLATRIYLSE